MDALMNAFSWPALWAVLISLEFWGAVTGLWDVWLCMKEDIKNFPIGIINIVIFFFMFWSQKLYGSAVLQVVFLVLSIWGWIVWLRGAKNTKAVAVSTDINLAEGTLSAVVGGAASYGFGRYLATTGDPSPYLDAVLAIFSVIAQYFMSKKVIQSWHIWICVDAVSIWVYGQSQLYITAGLYFVFLCLCLRGLYDWKNEPVYKRIGAGQVSAAT